MKGDPDVRCWNKVTFLGFEKYYMYLMRPNASMGLSLRPNGAILFSTLS
jgi:hypothetical protein